MTVHYTTSIGPDLQRSEFTDWFMPHHDLLKRCLWLLDGEDQWGFVLWPGPDGVDFWDVDMKKYPMTFLQAGGTKNAMTLEWKTNRDGVFRQYVLGRAADRRQLDDHHAEHEIRMDDYTVTMRSHETFSYEEAADIFYHYFSHDSPPAEYELRDLKLDFGPDGKVRES